MKRVSRSLIGQHIPWIWLSMLRERGKLQQKHDSVLTRTSILCPLHIASFIVCQKKQQTSLKCCGDLAKKHHFDTSKPKEKSVIAMTIMVTGSDSMGQNTISGHLYVWLLRLSLYWRGDWPVEFALRKARSQGSPGFHQQSLMENSSHYWKQALWPNHHSADVPPLTTESQLEQEG